MRNDLISYNGAYLYQVDDGTWEGNLLGFHYSADTLDELKSKIDKYKSNAENAFASATSKQYAAPIYGSGDRLFEESEEDVPVWSVEYYLGKSNDLDDTFDDNHRVQVNIEAPDFESAAKYATQYIIKMQKSENGERWANAEILSIERR
jgi:hypothetical protein